MFEPKYKKILERCLSDAIQNSAPGAVAYLGKNNERLFFGSVGKCALIPIEEDMQKETLFDLASLTKVIATTTAILLLYQQGKLKLDDPVYNYIPVPLFRNFTIRHLLSHSSGLIGYEWYREIYSLEDIIINLSKTQLLFEPGTNHLYSDFGFMILGYIVEIISGIGLDQYCKRNIFLPLSMNTTFFRVPEEYKNKCAPTEKCSWRNKIIRGEVHDENAYALGGVAGHAGLFSTAEDLSRFCRGLISEMLLKKDVIEEMSTCRVIPDYPWQVLGWKTDPFWESIEGQLPFRSALGHTGFTGTCLWWDRQTGYYAILLSNSCHPSRVKRDNRKLRKTFFNSVALLIQPQKMNVHCGIDVLMRDDFKPLKNNSIALFTNLSATNIEGKSTLEILSSSDKVKLKYIFSAEHGLRLEEEAGRAEQQKQWKNIQLIDIYLKNADIRWKKILGTVDWVVVDIQDIGSRYYTYIYSLSQLMKICSKYNKRMMVLDRPNPLGGEIIEGILPEPGLLDEVCWGRVPVRHGLTIGEAALFLKNTLPEMKSLDLLVIKMDGWFYDLLFPDLDLPWVSPSPNIPTFESALCYVGTCLFEGTNVSEGRGTKEPFQIIGAPWCNPALIISNLSEEVIKGFDITPCSFVPTSIPGKAVEPKYMNQQCRGLHIKVKDPYAARPFNLGIELLHLFKKYHPEYFQFNEHFERLVGSSRIQTVIEEELIGNAIFADAESKTTGYLNVCPRLYTKIKEEKERIIQNSE